MAARKTTAKAPEDLPPQAPSKSEEFEALGANIVEGIQHGLETHSLNIREQLMRQWPSGLWERR